MSAPRRNPFGSSMGLIGGRRLRVLVRFGFGPMRLLLIQKGRREVIIRRPIFGDSILQVGWQYLPLSDGATRQHPSCCDQHEGSHSSSDDCLSCASHGLPPSPLASSILT
jgi:hypothetical protein